ncbi:MAG TPA: L,D-transpeptidase [Ilumatobacter sp.]|nr:L,D-transpeptidase [Ilumatobacter sp.]
MVTLRRSWGALALATATVAVGTFAVPMASFTALAGGEPPDSTTPTTAESTTTTTTTTTTLAPVLEGVVSEPAHRDIPGMFQAMPTLPPPPTTTTTTIPFVDPTILPDNSGDGRRAVYSKSLQRVWLVEEDGTVTRTFRVSGRMTWNQPTPNNSANTVEPRFQFYGPGDVPAFYRVASRSPRTCNIKKPYLCWQYMVRFTKGGDEGDNIGFHQIPIDGRTNRPVQTLAQLGQPLSGGCIRQAPEDAEFVWRWAGIGTKVVVLA